MRRRTLSTDSHLVQLILIFCERRNSKMEILKRRANWTGGLFQLILIWLASVCGRYRRFTLLHAIVLLF